MTTPITCTIPQAAEILGVSPWTIRRLIESGDLTTRRFGRRNLLSRREVHALVDPESSMLEEERV